MSAAREVMPIREGGSSVSDTEPIESTPAQRESTEPGLSPAIRRRLPDERRALTHHFSIAGQEGYLTVGVYEDGLPGEIFITIAKQGSSISGLMDAFATVVLVTKAKDGSLVVAVWNLVNPGSTGSPRTVRLDFKGVNPDATARSLVSTNSTATP